MRSTWAAAVEGFGGDSGLKDSSTCTPVGMKWRTLRVTTCHSVLQCVAAIIKVSAVMPISR